MVRSNPPPLMRPPLESPPGRGRGDGCARPHPSRERRGGMPQVTGPAQRGFTLAEVLVALAVLAIAMAAVLGVMSQSIQTTVALRDRTLAMWLAQDRLTLQQLQRVWPSPDTLTGETRAYGRTWYWREQVSATPQADMRRVEIDIRADETKEVLAHLVGYLRRPSL